MSKDKIVLNGVGKGYLIGTDGNLQPLVDLEDMTIEINSTMEKVYGGDNLFPIYTFPKDKSATFTFTSATFAMDLLNMSQGASSVTTNVELFATETITLDGTGTATLQKISGIQTDSVVAVLMSNGVVLEKVAGTPTATEFTITSAGSFASNASNANALIQVSYVYTVSSNATGTDLLTTSIPGFVELRHQSQPIVWNDGATYTVFTRVYKARCDGKFQIEYKRGAAYAPKIAFEAQDPGRDDNRFISFAIQKS